MCLHICSFISGNKAHRKKREKDRQRKQNTYTAENKKRIKTIAMTYTQIKSETV